MKIVRFIPAYNDSGILKRPSERIKMEITCEYARIVVRKYQIIKRKYGIGKVWFTTGTSKKSSN